MKFNKLNALKSKKHTKVGRGISAGKGKTAGRGTKGQNSRGAGTRPGFEGGQNPLAQRLPKLRGFSSLSPKAENVYTSQLDELGVKVDNFSLSEAGLTSNPYVKVKLIVKGEVVKKHNVFLQGASSGAVDAVQKAGGTFELSSIPRREPKKPKTDK